MPKIIVKSSDDTIIKSVEVNIQKPLLGQLVSEGIDIPYACQAGICGACICYIDDDSRAVKNLRGEPSFPLGEGEMMTCIGGVTQGRDIILQTMT